MKIVKLLLFMALAFQVLVVKAHHGLFGDVDSETYLDLKGSLENIEWSNPHVVVHMKIVDDKGITKTWHIQADPPALLLERGLTLAALSDKNPVQVRVFPATSIPCSNECLGYGYRLRLHSGATHTLHTGVFEYVNQLGFQPK